MINGRDAKASSKVDVEDIIKLTIGERTTKVRVLSIDEKAGKDFAREMYELL